MSRQRILPTVLVLVLVGLILQPGGAAARSAAVTRSAPLIIDHRHTDLSQVPDAWIEQAKDLLRLSYGHTSHGSQLVSGMDAIEALDTLYAYNTNGAITTDVLSLHDYMPSGDLGNPDRTSWATRTRTYLNGPSGTGPGRNVVMWSWCGQVSSATEGDINTYLSLMNQLELDYPGLNFVYMTGHLDGQANGNLKTRNNQIRAYVNANNKVLFDFADIESYDPAGNYYPSESDGCAWCTSWCAAHPQDCQNLPSSCAHSHPLQCKLKGQAFWWMMARLAGWPGPDTTHAMVFGNAGVGGTVLSYDSGGPKTATADAGGAYSFKVPLGWTGTITPAKTGFTFTPASITISTPLTSDLGNQNFRARGDHAVFMPLIRR